MIRRDLGAAILALGISTGLPQSGLTQVSSLNDAADHGRWVWSRDHWVWVEKTEPVLRGAGIGETGVADSHSSPLHEAGLTVRRTIAIAMSAP